MDTRPTPPPAAPSSRTKAPMASSSSTISASRLQNHGQEGSSSHTPPPPPAGPATASRPARRPSTSAGSTSSKMAEQNGRPNKSTSSLSLKQKTSKKLDEEPKASKTDELLQSYTSGFDHMRQLVTCKICVRLMYEPYVVACGHIYCYSCLTTWFTEKKSKKTCPDCRVPVTEMPAPAYLVREMTQLFFTKVEYLPTGETIAQHEAAQKEEANIVQTDRDNTDPRTGGLFKGLFKARKNRMRMEPFRDVEDNVDRCPNCNWELESLMCAHCGFHADPESSWADSVEDGFSDLEQFDIDEEDMDGDMDEGDFDMQDGYDFDEEALARHLPHMQDWLEQHQMQGPLYGLPRPRAAHSAAGSRRRYSQSIASDRYTDDMDILEEEDEDEEDGDSSMNSFLDDGDAVETSSDATQSTESETPQPTSQQTRRARNRRIVEESESSSTSHAGDDTAGTLDGNDDDDDDDEDDDMPIAPGRRRRQQHGLARASATPGASSSTSTEGSAQHDLDEDTARLLEQQGWSPLAFDGPDQDMEAEDDDSDGASTTVGWEPTANSSNRRRTTNSLTPVADSLSTPSLPRPRTGQPRLLDGSRGLRRRTSILSVSTVNYEDGEADDDDSGIDGDGDSTMGGTQLRQRRSRVRLREAPRHQQTFSRPLSRHNTLGDGIDVDTDENSDETSFQSPRRRIPRSRQEQYDPRISWMFAQHQDMMFQQQVQQLDLLEQLRAVTPLARPRTSNRNRGLQQETTPTPFSPLSNTANPLLSPTQLSSRSRRGPTEQSDAAGQPSSLNRRLARPEPTTTNATAPQTVATNTDPRSARHASVDSTGTATTVSALSSTRPSTQHSGVSVGQTPSLTVEDPIERPRSRLPARPPSVNSRRVQQAFTAAQPGLQPYNLGLGLNMYQNWPSRNPYAPYASLASQNVQLRTRQSSQRLRNSDSTATLRASNSRRNLRPQPSQGEPTDPVYMARPRPSRASLRPQPTTHVIQSQPSMQRLSGRPSTRALRQHEQAHVTHHHPGPSLHHAAATSLRSPNAESTAPVQDRFAENNQPILRPNNPFHSRRTSVTNGSSTGSLGGVSGSQASSTSMSGASQTSPRSPYLSRRTSRQNIGPPAGVLPSNGPNTAQFLSARSASDAPVRTAR